MDLIELIRNIFILLTVVKQSTRFCFFFFFSLKLLRGRNPRPPPSKKYSHSFARFCSSQQLSSFAFNLTRKQKTQKSQQ